MDWFEKQEDGLNKSLLENGFKYHIRISVEDDRTYFVVTFDEETKLLPIDSFNTRQSLSAKETSDKDIIDIARSIIFSQGSNGISLDALQLEIRKKIPTSGKDFEIDKDQIKDRFQLRFESLVENKSFEEGEIFFLNKAFRVVNLVKQSSSHAGDQISIPSDSIIRILKEKVPGSGGQKSMNQWEILKTFNGKTVREFVQAAMNITMMTDSNTKFMSPVWWENELRDCLKKDLISLS